MDDKYKTKEQLINELEKAQQRIAELEASETRLKEIEESLHNSEEKYRKQFEEALDAIFIADAETGILIDCNRAASKLVGREKPELIGKHQRIIHPPEEIEGEFSRTFKQHLKEKEGQIIEAQVITERGEIRDVAIKANLFEVKGRKMLQGIFRDITERKKAEEALRESEQKYRDLYENAPDMYHTLDENGIMIECNETEARMLGYKKEEIIGRPVTDFFTDGSKNLFKKDFPSLNEKNELLNIEREFVRKDGTTFPVMLNVFSEYDENGNFVRARTISRDITIIKQTVKILQESEERYKRLLESITDYVYTVEIAEGRPVRTLHGPGCKAVTGYTPEEFAADPYLWFRMVYDEDKEAVTKQAERILSGERVPPLEHRIFYKDGYIRWVKNSTVPRYDDRGHIIAYDGLISDITERKKLEEQLLHAQKMEAIGQLAGGIAHDFNNILTAIIGFGNLLKMELGKDDPLRTYVKQILTSAERAANLTRALLAFSRKQIINLRPTNLNEIINVLKKLLSRLIGEDIELSTFLADEDLTVMADSIQIEQVLMNLATNSRDAMPDGGSLIIRTGRIEFDYEFIKAHGFGRPGSYAFISIEDTGEGIDEKMKERIFEPFFTTKEVGKGTGLGLSMVYGIIKQHEGYVIVYSEHGKGTTFKIYLPLIKSQVEEVKKAEFLYIKRGTETVLIAEDDARVRQLTKELLERFGYKVIEAVDGEDAIKVFNDNKNNIHLLILDVIMPKKNGKEVYDEIKKVRPDIKAIFMSGYTTDIIHKKGILEEGVDIILKPIPLDELLTKMREVLDK
jgi:two-component system cell cycle sensor histidine kinase/response regulator CckA